jgi:N-methylhydantoinase B
VSREKAQRGYGVVLGADGAVDAAATEAERARQRDERGEAKAFDFGPALEDTLAACEVETGLPAPRRAKPLRWSPLEDADAARARVRAAWEAELSTANGQPAQ